MHEKEQVTEIVELAEGYEKGKYYSSPIYRRHGKVRTETGRLLDHVFSALRLRDLKRVHIGAVSGVVYNVTLDSFECVWGWSNF